MDLLADRRNVKGAFLDFHADIPTQDDRIVITMDEAEEVKAKYLIVDSSDSARPLTLTKFPTKQKDYENAKEGIKAGEEIHTDEELME